MKQLFQSLLGICEPGDWPPAIAIRQTGADAHHEPACVGQVRYASKTVDLEGRPDDLHQYVEHECPYGADPKPLEVDEIPEQKRQTNVRKQNGV